MHAPPFEVKVICPSTFRNTYYDDVVLVHCCGVKITVVPYLKGRRTGNTSMLDMMKYLENTVSNTVGNTAK